MKERPILFSGPMVRALLAGTKTQTRRALKVQPPAGTVKCVNGIERELGRFWPMSERDYTGDAIPCPYGERGDRLWVRETLCSHGHFGFPLGVSPQVRREDRARVWSYAADCIEVDGITCRRPSIHMPRWASRITLEITDVRAERLQDISEDDAAAEGAPALAQFNAYDGKHVTGYARLWDSINGAGSWDVNPWVWVIEFKRAECHVACHSEGPEA